MIDRSTNIFAAMRSRQRGFLLNPFRFGGSAPDPIDPYFSDVSLLLHFDGPNNSTTFTDSSGSPKAATVYGNARISTADGVFGGSCGQFDGIGDSITYGFDQAFALGAGDFCIEFHFNPSSKVSQYPTIIERGSSWASDEWSITFDHDSTPGKLAFWCYNISNSSPAISTSVSYGGWVCCALTRSGSTIRMFVDGIAVGSITTSALVSASGSSPARIGPGLNGMIDEFRITLNRARYTSDYIVSTDPFPNS